MIEAIGKLNGYSKTELGGKAYSLNRLMVNGLNVPRGIILPAFTFISCLKENGVLDEVVELSNKVNFENADSSSQKLQAFVLGCELNSRIVSELETSTQTLGKFVSVRSSAASEDGDLHTFAGLHDSFLNINNNAEDIITAIKKCWASLFNERALLYRARKKIPVFEGMAIVVQNMIQAKCSGVVYTRHPIEDKYVLVESAFGIGDIVVDGTIKPDSFLIERDTLNIANKELGRKNKKTEIKNGIHMVIANEDTESFSISDDVLRKLVIVSLSIEKLFGKTQDIEWAYDDQLWLLQSRAVNF